MDLAAETGDQAEAGGDGGDTAVAIADDAPQDQEASAPAYEPEEAPAEPQQVELQALAAVASGDDDSGMVGKFFKFESDGKILCLKLQGLSEVPPDDTSENLMSLTSGGGGEIQQRKKTVEEIMEEKKKEKIEYLVPDSTNSWLYINDSALSEDSSTELKGCLKDCSDNCANKFIAIFVICIQIGAYIAMTYFLGQSRKGEIDARKSSCYGPNCGDEVTACMSFGTGGLTSVLLVGFLWADVVNTLSLMTKNMNWFIASLGVLAELFTAIICGFLVGVYSETDFDAIGGAVGILFVHDLDEKVFASMQVFRETGHATLKKIVAVSLWIVISVVVALSVSCKYVDDATGDEGALFGRCLTQEFGCASGSQCIWEGFVCNGVSDCEDSSDEFDGPGHKVCDYSLITCPGSDATTYNVDCTSEGVDADGNACHSKKPTHFMCESDGSCIPFEKRCNGVIDCDDGSDEGRPQNCQTVISKIKCDKGLNITTLSDGYKQKWSGNFKCNNGQCIDAAYACDGVADDCVDGSDEYPNFNKARESPWLVQCPYAKTMSCSADEVLCKTDGRCITKSAVCDGTQDCSDGLDEQNCEYSCKTAVKNQRKFQCGGNIASVNDTHIVTWFANASANADDYTIAKDDGYDWDPLFLGADGACIPVSWRCDGASDCEDNTDELLCGLFSCADDEYQCTDSGQCIPKSWLCDDISDCPNGEDETKSICQANGVDPSSNGCIETGFFYQCNGCPSCCLYSWQLCDGQSQCPGGEDELEATCTSAYDAFTSTTTTLSAGGSGSLSCGDTKTGSVMYYETLSFSFTAPSSGDVIITTCHTENQGEAFLELMGGMFPLYSDYDSSCNGCSYRSMIYASVGMDLTAGGQYVLSFNPYFEGTYKFDVRCGGSVSSGGTCTESTSAPGGGMGTTYYYP